ELAHTGLATAVVFFFDFVDKVLEQSQHAVPRPHAAPKVVGGITALRGRFGRIAGAAELALVERQKTRLRPGQMGSDVDQVWVNRKVRQAAPKGEQRLLGVAVKA